VTRKCQKAESRKCC